MLIARQSTPDPNFSAYFIVNCASQEGPYTELLMVHGGGLAKLMEAFAEDDSGSDTEFDPTGDEVWR